MLATTSCEVIPPGLSTMISPEGAVIGPSLVLVGPVVLILGRLLVRVRVAGPGRALPGAGQLLVGLPGGRDQVLDVARVVRQHVGDELDRRRVPQPELGRASCRER